MEDDTVGEDRYAIIANILSVFSQLAERGPRTILLSSPAGWGKTRIVHEVYRSLVSTQLTRYWPTEITSGDSSVLTQRKITHPSRFVIAEQAFPEWMWWGLLAGRREDGSLLPTIRTDDSQWFTHAAALNNRIPTSHRLLRGTAKLPRMIPVVGGILGCFFPPIGIMATAESVTQELFADGRRWIDLRRSARAASLMHVVDSDNDPNPGSTVDLANAVIRLSRAMRPVTPIVIFVEDAHLLDETTRHFVERLALAEKAPILLLLAAQSDELAVQQVEPSGLGLLLQRVPEALIECVELAPLADADLARLVLERYPATDPTLADRLAAKYSPNPLALELMLELDAVTSTVRAGALELSSEALGSLPTAMEDLYAQKWRALPESVRVALSIATAQGRVFVSEPVTQATLSLGVADGDDALRAAQVCIGGFESGDSLEWRSSSLRKRCTSKSNTSCPPN